MGCGLGLILAVTGVVGLIVAVAILGTGTALVRRAMADRRRRTALIDITGGLRILGRELRAGAEPSAAATNAGSAASGAGAELLRGLARLTRADDRPSVGSGSARHGGVAPRGSGDDRATTAAIGRQPARPDNPLTQAAARLRSGWLLTRRHGLAFTPLIDALAADLSEQIAADAERAGQVAGPRMSGYVMAVLPLLGLALGVGMGADPFRVLLLTPVGNILLLVGVLLTCTGLLWSARIVRR
jgi:tight adherence protein B